MVSGRKPEPLAVKLTKNRTSDRVQLPVESPDPPEWLIGAALDEWHRIMPDLLDSGVVARIDGNTLAMYCRTYADWLAIEDELDREGRTVVSSQGNVQLHPLAGHASKLLSHLRSLSREFGFSPASRKTMRPAQTSDNASDPALQECKEFQDFIDGKH